MPVGDVGDADRRVGRVDVLATRAGRSVGIDADIGFRNVDLDGIVDHRIDPDARKRGVTAGVAVIWRDPNQAVHAGFGLQPAIGVVALDQDRRRLDAGLFAVVDFQHFDLEAAAFGPARIHAQQHVRPVLALGAAGAGVDFEIGVVGVGLARKQRLDLSGLDLAGERTDRGFGFGDDAGIALLFAEFDKTDIVFKRLAEPLDGIDAVIQPLTLAHQFLGFLRVVPEGGVFGAVVQIVEAF